jgi:hypothetical protein
VTALTRLLVALAATLELGAALQVGSLQALLASTILGAAWVALTIWRPRSRLSDLGLWTSVGVSAFLAYAGPRVLPLIAVTVILLAWDSATQGRILAQFAPGRRVPFPPRYIASLGALIIAAPLLGLAGAWLPLRLPFPALLALLIAVLGTAAVVLWIGRRTGQTVEADSPLPRQNRGTGKGEG